MRLPRPLLLALGLLVLAGPAAHAQDGPYPRPILDAHPAWLDAYRAAWRTHPDPDAPLVDLAFAVLFGAYGPAGPARTAALDARYAGETEAGVLPGPGDPDGLGAPFLGWVEDRYARVTGDTSRVRRVLPLLVRHYAAVERARCRPDAGCHAAPAEAAPGGLPGDDAVAATAAQALGAQRIAALADRVGDRALARDFRLRALRRRIHLDTRHWDGRALADRRADSTFAPAPHAGAFWSLALGTRHADSLVAAAEDPARLAHPAGLAAVPRSPAATATALYVAAYGLRGVGRDDVARALAERYFAAAGTGRAADGLAPVALLLEDVLGFGVEGERGRLTWRLRPGERHGVEGLRLGDATVSLVATPSGAGGLRVDVETDRPFALVLWHGRGEARLDVPTGRSTFDAPPPH